MYVSTTTLWSVLCLLLLWSYTCECDVTTSAWSILFQLQWSNLYGNCLKNRRPFCPINPKFYDLFPLNYRELSYFLVVWSIMTFVTKKITWHQFSEKEKRQNEFRTKCGTFCTFWPFLARKVEWPMKSPMQFKKKICCTIAWQTRNTLWQSVHEKTVILKLFVIVQNVSIYEKYSRIKMKIEAPILLGSLFIIQLIPSECASINGKLYKVFKQIKVTII